jgi:hypothetical protein
MRRRSAHILTALACAVALAGCQRSDTSPAPGGGGAGDVDAFVKTLDAFAGELLSKVESAPDTKAGVAEAQALLDARKGDLSTRVAALKRGAPDAGAKAKLLEAEVDSTDRIHRLQLKYADAAARDPELKAGLERLIDGYDALFR